MGPDGATARSRDFSKLGLYGGTILYRQSRNVEVRLQNMESNALILRRCDRASCEAHIRDDERLVGGNLCTNLLN